MTITPSGRAADRPIASPPSVCPQAPVSAPRGRSATATGPVDVVFSPIKVETGCNDQDGRLIVIDGRLWGVLVRLAEPVHGELCGRWHLEVGFGSLAELRGTFATLAIAEHHIRQRVSRRH